MSEGSDILTREVLVEKVCSYGIDYVANKINDRFFQLEITKVGKWHIFFQWSKVVATRTFGSDTLIVRAIAIKNCETIQTGYHWGNIFLINDGSKNWFNHPDKNKMITGFFFGLHVIPLENKKDFFDVFKQHIKIFNTKTVNFQFPTLSIQPRDPTLLRKNLTFSLVNMLGNHSTWPISWIDRDKRSLIDEIKKHRAQNGILHTNKEPHLALH